MYQNSTGLPSVTQIIRPYIDLSWFTDEHAARGTAVHAACIAYVQGLFVPPLATDHKPYFESFKRWGDRIETVLLAEERLIDKQLRFTGKPDLIVKLKGEPGNVLIDLKTSQAEARWFRIQNAAYRHLAIRRAEPIVTHRGMTLRLKSDGSGCLATDYSGDNRFRKDLNIFIGLLNAHYYFN